MSWDVDYFMSVRKKNSYLFLKGVGVSKCLKRRVKKRRTKNYKRKKKKEEKNRNIKPDNQNNKK